MKHIKQFIDFNSYEIELSFDYNDKNIIKKEFPLFYEFLKKRNLIDKWLLSFKECKNISSSDLRTFLIQNNNKFILNNSIVWSCARVKFKIDWRPIHNEFKRFYDKNI
jgi:hypothetical protein